MDNVVGLIQEISSCFNLTFLFGFRFHIFMLLSVFSDQILTSHNFLLLGGGLKLRSVTEVAGQAGVGKTQACLHWCVVVQWPELWGGFEGRALFLDCDGSFCPERLSEIATGMLLTSPMTSG